MSKHSKSHIKRCKRIGKYVRWLAYEMGLSDWTYKVQFDPDPDEGNYASVQVTEGQQRFHLRLGSSFWDASPSEKKKVLIHELVHCHWWRTDSVCDTIQSNLGDQTWGVWHDCYTQQMELAVDNIAVAWARHIDDSKHAHLLES